MVEAEVTAIETVERAGIAERDAFTAWLAEMGDKARGAVEAYPVAAEIGTRDDYRHAKRCLAELRRVEKEADEGRKRITRELDAAKKALTETVAGIVAPVSEAVAAQSGAVRDYEARKRDEKKERLRAYWEGTYPALALCTVGEPLVPFERVFDPDWVKRMGEVGDDLKAREAMDGVADMLAGANRVIDDLAYPDRAKLEARAELYKTLDLPTALARAKEEAARIESVRAVEAARAPEPEPVEAAPEAPQGPQEAPSGAVAEAPAPEARTGAERPAAAVSEAPARGWVLTVEFEGDARSAQLRRVLESAGIRRENGFRCRMARA